MHTRSPTLPIDAAAAGREAYVSMWYGNSSSASFDGLKVLLHSLRKHDSRRPFVLLTTGVWDAGSLQLAALRRVYPMRVVRVPPLRSADRQCLQTMGSASGRL